MRLFFPPYSTLAAVYLSIFLARATENAHPLPIVPGAPQGSYIKPRNDSEACPVVQGNLTVKIQNDQSQPLFFYVTGRHPRDGAFVILQKHLDAYRWYVKPTCNCSTPYYFVNATNDSGDIGFHNSVTPDTSACFSLPSYVDSARLYVSQERLHFGTNAGDNGTGLVEPSATNKGLPEYNISWQFVEFTYEENNFVLNPSYVDFAAMSLDLTLTSGTGDANQSTVRGLEADALENICTDLKSQSDTDQQSWKDLCLVGGDGNIVRVISPDQYLALNPSDRMANYYDEYVNKVWERYKDNNLTINTQDRDNIKVANGREVICNVNSEDQLLYCSSQDVSSSEQEPFKFRKPTTFEIMGCIQSPPIQTPNGTDLGSPFTVKDSINKTQALIVPRLCAAFTRSTLLLEDGNIQPNGNITADLYYGGNITNHYSRIIHSKLLDQIGYSFAYDDTNPSGDNNRTTNAGGVIQDPDPILMLVRVR